MENILFDFERDNEGNRFYLFQEKLSNNQILKIKFYDEDEKYILISACVFSKRKHNYSEQITTGRVGIESLLLAKLGIKLFIEFLIKQNMKRKVVVGWADNRRRNVYYRGLKELGFEFEYLTYGNITKKYLTKNL